MSKKNCKNRNKGNNVKQNHHVNQASNNETRTNFEVIEHTFEGHAIKVGEKYLGKKSGLIIFLLYTFVSIFAPIIADVYSESKYSAKEVVQMVDGGHVSTLIEENARINQENSQLKTEKIEELDREFEILQKNNKVLQMKILELEQGCLVQ